MSMPVLIIGGGGHAKVLIESLRACSAAVRGVLDTNADRAGSLVHGIPVLGGDEKLDSYDPRKVTLVNGLGSIGPAKERQALFSRLKARGFSFRTVIHPSAIVAPDVVLGEGAQVMAGAVIQPGCRIGVNTIVNTKASIDHDCVVGDHVHLAPGVTISGNVRVGDGVHVGTGATVIQGITIGPRSVVGAGAVVVTDIPDDVCVTGVPAKRTKKLTNT